MQFRPFDQQPAVHAAAVRPRGASSGSLRGAGAGQACIEGGLDRRCVRHAVGSAATSQPLSGMTAMTERPRTTREGALWSLRTCRDRRVGFRALRLRGDDVPPPPDNTDVSGGGDTPCGSVRLPIGNVRAESRTERFCRMRKSLRTARGCLDALQREALRSISPCVRRARRSRPSAARSASRWRGARWSCLPSPPSALKRCLRSPPPGLPPTPAVSPSACRAGWLEQNGVRSADCGRPLDQWCVRDQEIVTDNLQPVTHRLREAREAIWIVLSTPGAFD